MFFKCESNLSSHSRFSQYCVSCPHLSRGLWPWGTVVVFSRPRVHPPPRPHHGHSIPTLSSWTLQSSCSPLSAQRRGSCWRPWPSGATLSVRPSSPSRKLASRVQSRSVREICYRDSVWNKRWDLFTGRDVMLRFSAPSLVHRRGRSIKVHAG